MRSAQLIACLEKIGERPVCPHVFPDVTSLAGFVERTLLSPSARHMAR
jgi:hypothetical protein